MEKKKQEMTPELKREIVELTIETYRKEVERQRKENRDRRLHNTRMLMEKYRGFVVHSESAVYNASQIDEDEGLLDILNLMDCGGRGLSAESVRQSVVRTRILVHHVQRMLDFYEYECKQSKRAEDTRRLRVIKALYIDEERKTPEELAEIENVDVRTIYRDSKAALQELSALIFGYFE